MTVSSTSLTAYKSLDVTAREQTVLDVIEAFGKDGCIYDEVQAALPHLPNSVSGRFLTLERKGKIYRNGETRPGNSGNPQKVMRHIKYLGVVPMLPIVKKKRTAFQAALIYAAKLILKAETLTDAKKALAMELRKTL